MDFNPSDKKEQPSILDNAREFASHALYASVEAPISGSYQLLNKVSGDNLPKWQAEAPKTESVYGQTGDIVGSAALFFGMSKLTRAGFAKAGLGEIEELGLGKQLAVSSLESGTSGIAIGLLQPVDDKDFWSNKLRSSAELGVTFGAMGAATKGLDATRAFGQFGKRTLIESISLNGLAGTAGGVTSSFAHAGIFEGRLPTLSEIQNNTAQYAALGATLGTFEWAVPKVTDLFTRKETPRTQLAHDVGGKFIGENAALPIFDGVEKLTYPDFAPMSAKALDQSFRYVQNGEISEPFQPGVKLATDVSSPGLNSDGTSIVRSDKYMTMDRLHDPVFDQVMTEAPQRFGGITDKVQLGTAISKYVSRLFNRFNLSGNQLESLYDNMIRRETGTTVPIGEFIRRGSGVCLQQAALFKAIAEELGMSVRLVEGTTKAGVPHVYTTIELAPGEHVVFDPAQQINGVGVSLVGYRTPKTER